MTKAQLNLCKEITEHNVQSHLSGLFPPSLFPLSQVRVNIVSVQKLQDIQYVAFSDDFLRISVQNLLGGEGGMCVPLAGSCVPFVAEMNVIEDAVTLTVARSRGQFWGVE